MDKGSEQRLIMKSNGVLFQPCVQLVEALPKIMDAYFYFAPHVVDVVITSASDGVHMDDSLHYCDRAIDLRTWHIERRQLELMTAFLRDELTQLSPFYDVVLETDHLHIEYDDPSYDREAYA